MYKILIADDEPFERKALRKILFENIPEITAIEEACDGQAAIEKAKQFSPDIIILDIKMPRVNGLEAAKRIKEFYPKCCIVLLSGYTYFKYAKEAVSIGINDFLVKPVSDEELFTSIKNLIKCLEKQNEHSNKEDGKSEKMNNLYNCIENELITSLPFRQMKEPYLSSYLEALDIEYKYSVSMIIKCEQQLRIREFEIEQVRGIVKSVFSPNRVFVQEFDGLIYSIIFLTQKTKKSQINDYLEKMVKMITTHLLININTGVGTIKSEAAAICESFYEARQSLSSERTVSLFTPDHSMKKTLFSVDPEENLLEFIMIGNIEKSLEWLRKVCNSIDEACDNLQEYKIRVYEMLLVLKRKIRREVVFDGGLYYHVELDDFKNRNEVKDYLRQEVLRLADAVNDHMAKSNKAWKTQICSFLENNFNEGITLHDLADIAGFSESYLSRIFKKEFGKNCISYINSLRIKKAKKLLTTSSLSVKEIAYAIGYSDANYFARVFRKETGFNATQYKNSAT